MWSGTGVDIVRVAKFVQITAPTVVMYQSGDGWMEQNALDSAGRLWVRYRVELEKDWGEWVLDDMPSVDLRKKTEYELLLEQQEAKRQKEDAGESDDD